MSDPTGKFRTAHKIDSTDRKKIYYYLISSGQKFYECFSKPVSKPYPRDFLDAFSRAEAALAIDDHKGQFAELIQSFTMSPKFSRLADATKEDYLLDLRDACREFGECSILEIEDRSFRKRLVDWHDRIAVRSPRRADLCVSTLSSALSYAHARGVVVVNHAKGIEKAYTYPTDKEPWSKSEIKRYLKDCPKSTKRIFALAMFTGLRRSDLANVTWDSYNGQHIHWKTHKSRGKRDVFIPLTPLAQKTLNKMKASQSESVSGLCDTILTLPDGRRMRPHYLGQKVNNRAKALGINKTLHRLRATYATNLVLAGFGERDIADTMGWSLEQVNQLTRVYVHTDNIVAAKIKRLSEASARVGFI